MAMASLRIVAAFAIAGIMACAPRRIADPVPRPTIIPHSQWDSVPPLGYPADAVRRNKAAGDSLKFRDLSVVVVGTSVDSSGGSPRDIVQLRLRIRDSSDVRSVAEGA